MSSKKRIVTNPGPSLLTNTPAPAPSAFPIDGDKDLDFDQELSQIPQEEDQEITDAPVPQPDFDESDDEEIPVYAADKKFSLLYDLILTKAESEEQFDEWSYQSLIKELENEEPQEERDRVISVLSPDNSLIES